MMISNTVNDFVNNFQLTVQSSELYYEKYYEEFSDAGLNNKTMIHHLPNTITKLETDISTILKINTKLVHIIFDVRLTFLKQYHTYLQPEFFLLIANYEEEAVIQMDTQPRLYFFIEALCKHADQLYEIVAYYFTKLYIQTVLNQTTRHNNEYTQDHPSSTLLEEAIILHIMNETNVTYPFKQNNNFNIIKNIENELSTQYTTENLINLLKDKRHINIIDEIVGNKG